MNHRTVQLKMQTYFLPIRFMSDQSSSMNYSLADNWTDHQRSHTCVTEDTSHERAQTDQQTIDEDNRLDNRFIRKEKTREVHIKLCRK
jgi:hypothetical protein